MKRLAAILLVFALVFALAACGEPDPNCGLYVATTATMDGVTVPAEVGWEGGFSIELKNGGSATLTMDGEDYRVKWKLDGETITVTASDAEFTGTLKGDTMVLLNMLDSGMDLTLVKQG